MTKNQIEYWKNEEQKRHNLVTEEQGLLALQEQQRANKAQESLMQSAQFETARSNQARETETHRANLATELANLIRNQETIRSNQAAEQLQAARISNDYEIGKANVATNWANIAVASKNAATNALNAQTNQLRMWNDDANTKRANEIKANQSPYSTLSNAQNKLTTFKSVATLVGSSVSSLVTNLANTVKTTANKLVSSPKLPPANTVNGNSVQNKSSVSRKANTTKTSKGGKY